jgi:hypothetical protein
MGESASSEPFVVSFPVWVIVNEFKFRMEGIPNSLTTFESHDGKMFLIFRQAELAEQFLKKSAMFGKTPLKLITPRALREILKAFERIGGKYVGIDFPGLPVTGGHLHQIREVIDALPDDAI